MKKIKEVGNIVIAVIFVVILGFIFWLFDIKDEIGMGDDYR